MQKINDSPTQQHSHAFRVVTIFGAAALLLGLALILFAHYHERAYIFLGLGSAGFTGGIVGIVGAESKVKTALSFGVIAPGMVGIVVGFNYLISFYGPHSHYNLVRGSIVIALGILTILAGVIGALLTRPKGDSSVFSSVFLLGMVMSIGIVTLIAATICLVKL